MSSINPYFTFNYSQPEDYRFSHDSVFLARQVFQFLQTHDYPRHHILDLCSGCGIVGLDLLFHLQQAQIKLPAVIDFLEVQAIYQTHFQKNVEIFNSLSEQKIRPSFININYDQLLNPESPYEAKYDLIVSNPPYFRKDQGILSKSEFKNRCRFFIDSDFKNLITAIDQSLNKQGRAFVLLKSLSEHGISIEKEFTDIKSDLILKKLTPIRDTDFYELQKST